MIPVGILTAAAISSFRFLLDEYPGAFSAFSISRKLRFAYTGAAIQVGRLSDGVTLDIGFVNNVLDLTTLTTFIGSGSGSVTKIYDQSGNANNAISGGYLTSPLIINSGSLITLNTKPAVEITISKSYYTFPTASANNNITVLGISKRRNINQTGMSFGNNGNMAFYGSNLGNVDVHADINNLFNYRYTNAGVDVSTLAQLNSVYVGNVITAFINDQPLLFTTSGQLGVSIGLGFTNIGFSNFNSQTSEINFSEAIFYNSNQVANRIGINNNINTFYSLYTPITPVIVSDPDAQAFVDRVFNAGGVLTQPQADAVNTLTISLKFIGIWSLMKVIYPMVGGTAASCAQNLKNNSYTGTFNGGWTISNTGITGNSTNTFLNTALNLSTNTTLYNVHYSLYIRNNTNAGIDIGVTNSASGYTQEGWMLARDGGNALCGFYDNGNTVNGGGITVSNANSQGFYVSSALASNNIFFNKNSTLLGTFTGSNTSIPANGIVYIGAINDVSSTAIAFTNREYAFASIGDGLTTTQASDFYTTVQAYQTTLGRQV